MKRRLILFITIFLLLVGCADITEDTGKYSNTADNQKTEQTVVESTESASNISELRMTYEQEFIRAK